VVGVASCCFCWQCCLLTFRMLICELLFVSLLKAKCKITFCCPGGWKMFFFFSPIFAAIFSLLFFSLFFSPQSLGFMRVLHVSKQLSRFFALTEGKIINVLWYNYFCWSLLSTSLSLSFDTPTVTPKMVGNENCANISIAAHLKVGKSCDFRFCLSTVFRVLNAVQVLIVWVRIFLSSLSVPLAVLSARLVLI